jgi:hypothetical protein
MSRRGKHYDKKPRQNPKTIMTVMATASSNLTYRLTELEQFSQELVTRQLSSSEGMNTEAEEPS